MDPPIGDRTSGSAENLSQLKQALDIFGRKRENLQRSSRTFFPFPVAQIQSVQTFESPSFFSLFPFCPFLFFPRDIQEPHAFLRAQDSIHREEERQQHFAREKTGKRGSQAPRAEIPSRDLFCFFSRNRKNKRPGELKAERGD